MTHFSLHNHEFWTPSTQTQVKSSGCKWPSAQQHSPTSPDSPGESCRATLSQSSSRVLGDDATKMNEIISISSDEESDVEDESHEDGSQKSCTRLSHQSTSPVVAFKGSTKPLCCRESPGMSTCDEWIRTKNSQHAAANAVCLVGAVDTAHTSPSPRASGDAISTSDDAALRMNNLASVAGSFGNAQLSDTFPSVEALAASAKEQSRNTDSVGTWRNYPPCRDIHQR